MNKEDPDKCILEETIDDYNTQTVYSGEVCTIETAKQYGIFGKNQYFNRLIPKDEKIDVLIGNKEGSNHSLCNMNGEIAYQNCVLTTKNPWKTLDKNQEFCMLPLDVSLPDSLKFNEQTKMIEKPTKIPKYLAMEKFCQEKWYDWFSIPDYHFGNKYEKINISSNETKCMKPCDIGTLPYNTGNNSIKCILRDKFEYGFYASTFNYLPIALIMLLGSTKETLMNKQDSILETTRSRLEDITTDYDMYAHLISDEKTRNNIYEDIKNDLRYNIKNLFNIPFDETNILPPSSSVQKLSNRLMSKDRIMDAYNIAKNFYDLSNATDTEGMKAFIEWKKNLADISGFGLNDKKFYKQLLILKKACNVAFDNKSKYSNEFIMYVLNQDLEEGQKPYPPISFVLTKNDIILSIAENNVDDRLDEMNTSNIEDIQNKLINEDKKRTLKIQNDDKVELNDSIKDPFKYETDESCIPEEKKEVDKTKESRNTMKTIIVVMLFLIVLCYVLALILLIISMFWTPFTRIVNEIILGFCFYVYYVRDMFRGRYSPSSFNLNILELQRNFIDKKIFKDIEKYMK